MRGEERDGYDAWLSGELLLFGLLGAALALFIESPSLRHAWETPSLALVLDTTITLAASALIAAAPFVRGTSSSRQRALGNAVAALLLLLAGLWLLLGTLGLSLPALATGPTTPDPPALLTLALSLQAVLSLVALIGFGLRYRNRGDDLSRWLASAATLSLFSA